VAFILFCLQANSSFIRDIARYAIYTCRCSSVLGINALSAYCCSYFGLQFDKFVSGDVDLQGGQKGATDSWPQFCQFLTDLRNVFTGRFCGKFAVTGIWDIKNPAAPCICCYTTLWNVNVSKTSPVFWLTPYIIPHCRADFTGVLKLATGMVSLLLMLLTFATAFVLRSSPMILACPHLTCILSFSVCIVIVSSRS